MWVRFLRFLKKKDTSLSLDTSQVSLQSMEVQGILLEDYKYGQVPQTIRNLLEVFNRANIQASKTDVLAGFIYILMLECGFVPTTYTGDVTTCDFNYQRLLELSTHLPPDWKSKSHNYQFKFILQSSPEHVCRISCIIAGDDFIINCIVTDLRNYTMILDPLLYFISSNIDLTNTENINVFQNLNLLSKSFKDTIAFPVKSDVFAACGGVCGCLRDLPSELVLNILKYLKIDDLLNISQTSVRFCSEVQNMNLWIKLLDAKFRKSGVVKSVDDLKLLYAVKYRRQLQKTMKLGPIR